MLAMDAGNDIAHFGSNVTLMGDETTSLINPTWTISSADGAAEFYSIGDIDGTPLWSIDTDGVLTVQSCVGCGAGGGLADPGGNGIVVRTAEDVTTFRTITGTTNEIEVTDGDGQTDNPTISLPATVDMDAKTSVLVPTKGANDNTTAAASTEYVQSEFTAFLTDNVALTNKTFLTGSQTSFQIPNTTGSVASATSQIAVNSYQQGAFQFWNTNGGVSRYLNAEKEQCKTIESLVPGDDGVLLWAFRRPGLFISNTCFDNSTATPTVTLKLNNTTTVDTPACGATPSYDTTMTTYAIAAGDYLSLDTGNTATADSWVTICWT